MLKMKYQFCVLLITLALCANAFPFGVEEAQATLTEAKNEFTKWKTTFKKVYNDVVCWIYCLLEKYTYKCNIFGHKCKTLIILNMRCFIKIKFS